LIETPHDVVIELANIRAQSERGVGLLREAEQKLIALTLAAERAEAAAFLDAQGTVADRQAVAKIQALPAREAAELAKVEVNYIKTKLKSLSESMMAVQTSARMIELQWKTAGIER
jgi:hypothetical protein